jgi:hypothetical protein
MRDQKVGKTHKEMNEARFDVCKSLREKLLKL